jgi:hypothetical protein
MSVEITRKLQELDAATFQELCDELLPFLDEEYQGLEPHGRLLTAKKTRKGTPDSYVRCGDGKFIAIQHTTEQTKTGQKVLEDIEACADPQKCKIHEKINKVVICFNSQLGPEELDACYKTANEKGWKLEYFSLNKLTKEIEGQPELMKKFWGIELPSEEKPVIGDDIITDGEEYLKRSGLKEESEKEGYEFVWAREDKIQTRLLGGHQVVYGWDGQERKCRIRWGDLVLMRKEVHELADISDTDALNVLDTWFNQNARKNTKVMFFEEVDRENRLPPGTAKVLLEWVAHERGYTTKRKDEKTILFDKEWDDGSGGTLFGGIRNMEF